MATRTQPPGRFRHRPGWSPACFWPWPLRRLLMSVSDLFDTSIYFSRSIVNRCCSLADFLSPSAASGGFAPAPPCWPFGPDPGLGPLRFWDPGRPHGPARAVTSEVTVAMPGGDVTRGRDHRPPALPPGPRPYVSTPRSKQVPGPLLSCQGPQALTQRASRLGRPHG
jgi:hypothetical protein